VIEMEEDEEEEIEPTEETKNDLMETQKKNLMVC
jgi:hypothetical protein